MKMDKLCKVCNDRCIFSRNNHLLNQLQAFNRIDYEKGETIFEQGEPVSGFYVVCWGQVKEGWRTSIGEKRTVRILNPGGLLAIADVLSGQDWHNTYAVSLAKSSLLFIDKKEVQILLRDSKFTAILTYRLAQDTIFLQKRLEMSSYSVSERIATILLTLSKEYGKKEQDRIVIDFELTNNQIAELAGCSPIVVSRTLCMFIKRGWIARNRRKIAIVEEQDLVRLAADVVL